MTSKGVHEVIVDELARHGTECVFGLMGEDTAALTTDLDRCQIAYYQARHENVAVTMADGWAWASGGTGIAFISRGPGLTNAMTAIATAAKAGRRVLVVTGDTSPGRVSDLKIIDQRALIESVGAGYLEAAQPEAVVDALRDGLAAADAGRTTVVAITHDVLHSHCNVPDAPPAPPPPAPPRQPDPHVLAQAVELVASSSRPLVLVGRGGMQDRVTYEALADRIGALLGTTLLAKGLFSGSPLDVGVVGGFANHSVRPILRDVDCVLAFGASLNGFTRGHDLLFPDARIVQFDLDSQPFGRHGEVDISVVGDALTAARSLVDALPARAQRPLHDAELLERLATPDVFGPEDESSGDGIDPRVLSVLLDEVLPQDRLVLADGGHHLGFGASALRVPGSGRIRLTADFAAVGMGLGAACGAAVARPDATTVLMIGDGGLAMTLGDLETIARYRLPIATVVMDDRAYGAERHYLDLEDVPHHHSLFEEVDFAGVAAKLGIEAITINTKEDVAAHADRLAAAQLPILVHCRINPAVRAQWLTDLDAVRKRVTAASA